MSDDILVSVIIPTYKRSDKIKKALDCVLNQTYKNIEILIIDDNSDEIESLKTYEQIRQNLENNHRIKYIKNSSNLGGALSRNEGIKKSKGKYVAFLDDDDEFYPLKIQKQVELSEIENLDICYCFADILDEKGLLLKKIKNYVKKNECIFEKNLNSILITTTGLFIKKEFLLKIGGFKKLICGQEYELLIRALDKNPRINCVKEELFSFVDHNEERITNNKKRLKGIEVLYQIKKEYFYKISKRNRKKIEINFILEKINLYWYFKEYKDLMIFSIKNIFKILFNLFLIFELILDKKEEIKRRIFKKIR
ncbi:MAG: glycosyltransferase family 2 protein [Cetobacterium sp.]